MNTPIKVNPNAALLGEVVTWDMAAQEVAYADVITALRTAGLPESAATDLRPVTAFGRAVRDLRAGRSIDRVARDSTSGAITFQFTQKALNEQGLQIAFAYEAICELQPADGTITCPESPEIEAHARRMFGRAMAHRTTSDITRLVQRLFQTHADLFAINPKKGVAYFVPEAHRTFTAQVEQFLTALGGQLLRFPVPAGTPAGNHAVKTSVEDGLAALSRELDQAVDQWDEKTRPGTMEKATARWQQIEHKAEAYSEYLGDRQASLLAILAEQKKRLARKVMQITEARDARDDTQRPLFPGATVSVDTADDDDAETVDTADDDVVETVDYYDTETGEFQLVGS